MSVFSFLAKTIENYDSPNSIGFAMRKKRMEYFKPLIEKVFNEQNKVNIIDIGGTLNYWKLLPDKYIDKYNVHITISNVQDATHHVKSSHFSFMVCDGCNMTNIQDNSFDIVHSNSVIEHVGSWEKIIKFSREVRRIARLYYIQTPNFWFPIEPHFMFPFFHWLPKPIKIILLCSFCLGREQKQKNINAAIDLLEGIFLLDFRMLKELFPDAALFRKERFFFMTKSLIAIKDS